MALGVHSEVGLLARSWSTARVSEHTRLTPSNAEDLLFDDVLWVSQAKREHDASARSCVSGAWRSTRPNRSWPRRSPGRRPAGGCAPTS